MMETIKKLRTQIEGQETLEQILNSEPMKNKSSELIKKYSQSAIEKEEDNHSWSDMRHVKSQRIAVVFDDE